MPPFAELRARFPRRCHLRIAAYHSKPFESGDKSRGGRSWKSRATSDFADTERFAGRDHDLKQVECAVHGTLTCP